MKRINALAVLGFTLFISMMVSAQAQAFYADGLRYVVTDTVANTVEVYGREPGNTETDITIPDSVFNNNVTYSVTTIGILAFKSNNLNTVTIGNSVTTIGANAFARNALTSLTIPDSVTTIGTSAFERNNLNSLTIGTA